MNNLAVNVTSVLDSVNDKKEKNHLKKNSSNPLVIMALYIGIIW